MAAQIRKRDLIVLAYRHEQIIEAMSVAGAMKCHNIDPTNFTIDLERKVWTYLREVDIPIGQARNKIMETGSLWGHKGKYGVIGVYNRRYLSHLDRMVKDAMEFKVLK